MTTFSTPTNDSRFMKAMNVKSGYETWTGEYCTTNFYVSFF